MEKLTGNYIVDFLVQTVSQRCVGTAVVTAKTKHIERAEHCSLL